MTRLKRLLHKNLITLIVEINDESAGLSSRPQIAEKCGADALLLNDISQSSTINKVKIPVGVKIDGKDFKNINRFDFVDFHIDFAGQMENVGVSRIAALDENFSFEQLKEIESKAEALDAAIIPLKQRVKDLSVGDLQNYISIIMSAGLPVIIPTQRLLRPSEVAIITDAGAKGIILTKTVLGESLKNFEKTIREFRVAADDLGA